MFGKIPRKFPEIDGDIWDNFLYPNVVSNSTDFEIKLRFFPKFEFKVAGYLGDLCSLLQIHQCTNLNKECSKMIYKH
jgi:hypothetical protein